MMKTVSSSTSLTALLLSVSVALLTACTTAPVDNNSDSAIAPAATNASSKGVINVDNAKLKSLREQKVTLVDIRLPEEWAQTGVIPGSKKLTFFNARGMINPDFVPQFQRLAPAGQPVALVCRTGNRTQIASRIISMQLGYDTVYNVKDGITGWIAEGNPTVK